MKYHQNFTEADAYRIIIRDLLVLLNHADMVCECPLCKLILDTYRMDPRRPMETFSYQTLLRSK